MSTGRGMDDMPSANGVDDMSSKKMQMTCYLQWPQFYVIRRLCIRIHSVI